MKSSIDYKNVYRTLSYSRLSTYNKASNDPLALYQYNLKLSMAFFECISICEIVIRNTIDEILQAEYGNEWAFNLQFERTIPCKQRVELIKARSKQNSTEKIIPELNFVFWQNMFTRRFDNLWSKYLPYILCDDVSKNDFSAIRTKIHNELDVIRKLRNRIAHHEPIFYRDDLLLMHQSILSIIGLFSIDTAKWLSEFERVSEIIKQQG